MADANDSNAKHEKDTKKPFRFTAHLLNDD